MANREFKRLRAKDEALAEQGEGQRTADAAALGRDRQRTPPREFLREVRQELKKVAWPSRSEVVNYTLVVLAATVFLTAIVFGMDFVFGRLVFTIFGS